MILKNYGGGSDSPLCGGEKLANIVYIDQNNAEKIYFILKLIEK